MTIREFVHNIKEAASKVQAFGAAHPELFVGGAVWSMDNVHAHGADADCAALGIKVMRMPPYSPDMHQVVEHAIGYLKDEFQKAAWAEGRTDCNDPNHWWRLLQGVAERVLTAAYVAKAVDSQRWRECLRQIATPAAEGGLDGGRPSKHWR